ncbi:MAG TPA: glycoside hydrolase family 2 TIM barrel-domain containing protein [Balneolales bacterium]|nr:glycoside hydrolase family 2 TIM barrel-domain containing protein [Balneolales bacterium]
MGDKRYSRKDFLKSITAVTLGTVGVGLAGTPALFAGETTREVTRRTGESVSLRQGSSGSPNIRPFDQDWRFVRDDVPGAELSSYDDAGWSILDLPHDWSIEDLSPKKALPSLSITEGEWKFRKGDNAEWSTPSFDDRSWERVNLPGYWNHYSDSDPSGSYGWYRKEIEVPGHLRGKDFLLNLGRIADTDEAFFNGMRIGGTGDFPPEYRYSYYSLTFVKARVYRVPAHLVRKDRNVVAVKVYCHNEKGGIYASAPTPRTIGPFSPESPGGGSTGHTMGGIGWYRKEFKLDKADQNKRVSILFDGVYMKADTWINDHYLGNHPYGYTSYGYDLTPYLTSPGQPNIVSIRVDNTGRNSRWYSGSGIYRHVQLRVTDAVHFSQWGLYVTTPQVTDDQALVEIESTIKNDSGITKILELESILYNQQGGRVGHGNSTIAIGGDEEIQKTHLIKVDSPLLWSPDNPNLYNVQVNLILDGEKIDQLNTTVGIRSIEVDATHGLRINGKPVLLKGGCMHHCNGPLGSKAIDRAEERRVELMKKHGFNAIRTSHNPPSPAFLDACDRIGMLVMDEAFDCWDKGKMPMDYHLYFKQWWRKDIESMIKRDRNHPSVILWSIGNEIPDRAELSGLDIEKELVSLVHRLDPTRPVTEAINGVYHWSSTAAAYDMLDVGGYNYLWKQYAKDHQKYPERVMVGTESFPLEAFENWQQVEKHPWVIGDFVWTGMDYLGESGIGHSQITGEHTPPESFGMPWPWFDSNCGDIDICGFKKPQSYYRDVVWGQSKLEMAVHSPIRRGGQKEELSKWGWPDEHQSWNWAGFEGKKLNVRVFTRCRSVRLELNGKVVARKEVSDETRLIAEFEVPYEAGDLRAIGIEDGKETVSKVLKTSGRAYAIRLTPDRTKIKNSRNDLSYVTAEIIDKKGNRVPDAGALVEFAVSGGELAAVGNGNPSDMMSFHDGRCPVFRGRCLAIVRSVDSEKGRITLKSMAKGLKGASVTIETQ